MGLINRNKKDIFALTFGLMISFIMLEILLRIYPLDLMRDDVYTRYDKDVSWMPMPNQRAKLYISCLKISPIIFNSNGFRDKEWIQDENYKIAVLGDSFMQG